MVKTQNIEYMNDSKMTATRDAEERDSTVVVGERLESSPFHHLATNPGNHDRSGGEDSSQALSPVFTTLPSGGFRLELGAGEYPFRRWMPALGRVITGRFAFDTETTVIDEDRPARIPVLVVGTAFDGRQGWFITADDMRAFLAAHPANPLIFHNAAFDLAVLQATYDRQRWPVDIYARVEAAKVADTQILARLLVLATAGHSARNQCSLDYCSQKYLSLALPKDLKTASGDSVRRTFGRYLGRPFETIPTDYLRYAAADPVATWLLFERLKSEVPVIKAEASWAFGYATPAWLDAQWKQHGPLTHDIQLKASIALDRISRTGVLIDQSRRDEKVAALESQMEAARRELALAGLPVEGKGASAALRKRIERLATSDRNIPILRTDTGQVATDEEQLKELSAYDPVLGVILRYRHASKLHGTYLKKMSGRVPRQGLGTGAKRHLWNPNRYLFPGWLPSGGQAQGVFSGVLGRKARPARCQWRRLRLQARQPVRHLGSLIV